MLIDSHCHIPHKNYVKTTDQLISDAKKNSVTHLIAIGTSLRENARTLKTIEGYDNVYATIGIYPHDDKTKMLAELYDTLNQQYTSYKDKIVGIGECGIDLTDWGDEHGRTLDNQKELFKMQVGFALEKDLPIAIHNRNGDAEVLEVLSHYNSKPLKGVMHCYSSDWEYAKKILAFGLNISFTANVTYPSAKKSLLEVVNKVPMDRFLLESDAPYLPPQGHRGEINYPEYVKITAAKIAEVKKMTFEEVAKATFKNTCDLFAIKI